MSAMFLAMVWHAQRRQARRSPRCRASRRARVAARAAGAVPARRLARAADAGDDRARPSRAARREQPERARSSRSRSTSSAGSSGSSSGCCCSRRPSSRASCVRGDRRRGVPRGRLHPLVRGRAARLAARTSISPGGCAPTRRRCAIALDALLENAVKYTEPDDTIELRAHADGAGAVVIEVADGGCGSAARGARPDLRPLRPRGRRAHPGTRRRRPRPLDRRRGREGARWPLLRPAPAARDGVQAPSAGTGCARRSGEPDAGR